MDNDNIYRDPSILRPARAMIPILLVALFACATPGAEIPVAREQETAKHDVWRAAGLRGVAFRAIGQEPGWLLEITDGREILIVTNYGQERKSYPYVDPVQDEAALRTVFQIDADTRVLIEDRPCTDTMSGESFPASVKLSLGAGVLRGCGQDLL